jgi:hypothetical protein
VDLAPDDAWASYARTVVEIVRPHLGTVWVRAARVGIVGVWPWPFDLPVHILTAWDPRGERPPRDVNKERQASLEQDLGPLADGMWTAVGVDPVTGHREEGVAVSGVHEPDALTLGAHYDQEAIFVWTPQVWAIVACDGSRSLPLGWSVAGPPLRMASPHRTERR